MVFSYDHKTSLGYLTGLANRQLSYTLAARFQAAGINMTAEQWGVILLLLNGDAQTQGQIGQQLLLEKSSTSRLLNGLERRGWITRTRNPKDSRQKLVTPTPRVLETAERCAVIARQVIADAQRGMTQEEQFVCRSFLSRIIENLNNMGK
jgi:DNA-binding MarR family transcriptional regulator